MIRTRHNSRCSAHSRTNLEAFRLTLIPLLSLSLHHHRGKTHQQLDSMPNCFPQYDDGDVHIAITQVDTYQLHSSVLKRGSPIFALLLDDSNVIKPTKGKKKGVIRFRLQLNEIDGCADGYWPASKEGCYALELNHENPKQAIYDPHDFFIGAWSSVSISSTCTSRAPANRKHQSWSEILNVLYGNSVLVVGEGNNLDTCVETTVEDIKVATYLRCVSIQFNPLHQLY